MDHSEENVKDIIRTSLSEETIPAVPSFSETFRLGARGIDLKSLRAFCLAPNGLVSPEWRKAGWPKLVGAHVEIWRAAARIPPMDLTDDDCYKDDVIETDNEDATTTIRLHHPSRDEIAYIKQVVASCEWESIGILKDEAIVMPEHNPRRPSSKPPSPTAEQNGESSSSPKAVERRVSFHLAELAFSTKRQKDRKTLRKVLIHLKRTNPNLAITSATCSAVAMVLSIVQSSSLSTLVVQQLLSYPWKYSREWPRSNDAWELDDQWLNLMRQLAPDLVQHFETYDVDVLEGTIRYSWIPSWLSQNVPNKDLLARMWDVLVPSKPDAILYVCISLLSHFQYTLMAETDTSKIRSVIMDLPSKLNSMDKAEAVLSQAMAWMMVESASSLEEDTEMDIPGWVTATVAPADGATVAYSRHLRETVTKEGKALISNGTSSARQEENDWFSMDDDDPKSRFVLAFKAKPLKENGIEGRRSSHKSSWILVLIILLVAAAVIFGLETDCSVLLGSKGTTQSNCFNQVSDLYWEDAMRHVSQMQAMGRHFRDEIRQVLWEPKMTDTSTGSGSGGTNDIQEEEVVDSPSENLGEALDEESVDEAPRQLNREDIAHDQEAVDESGSESSFSPEDDSAVDQDEPDPPEPVRKEPNSISEDSNMDDNDAVESDDPVEQSRRDVERLLKETLHQTEAAIRFAERIVSQFLEDAKTNAGEKAVEDVASEAAQEPGEVQQPDQSSDDHTGNAGEELIYSDHHSAVDDSIVVSDEQARAEMGTREISLSSMEEDDSDKDDAVSPEPKEWSKQGPEAPNDDHDQASSEPIEDRVDEDLEEEAREAQDDEVDITAQDNSGSTHPLVEIEESESGTATLSDDGNRNDIDGEEGIDEVFGDTSDDSSEDGGPMSEPPPMEGDTADETIYVHVEDKTDEKKLVDEEDQVMEPDSIDDNNDGPNVLGMAQGLLFRYMGYFSSEPYQTIQLSTPFFSKDDVAAVFEELMASNMDKSPMQKWDEKSKVRFSTWEGTILI